MYKLFYDSAVLSLQYFVVADCGYHCFILATSKVGLSFSPMRDLFDFVKGGNIDLTWATKGEGYSPCSTIVWESLSVRIYPLLNGLQNISKNSSDQGLYFFCKSMQLLQVNSDPVSTLNIFSSYCF